MRRSAGVETMAEIGPRRIILIGASRANRRVGGLGAADAIVAESPSANANAIRAPMAEPLAWPATKGRLLQRLVKLSS